jgi:hypothetical protein
VVISGIANTNVSNIATNVTDIATNAADIIVVSGIVNTNVSNIASNLVEIRANSASGVVISGIAETAYGWGDHSLQSYSISDTTYTAGSGLELHGTAFQAAISGANLLATNTPSDNQLASYDAATGKFTWVSAGAGGENNEFSFKTISVAGQSDVVADTTTDTLTLAAGSNVTITTNSGTDTITMASTDTTYSTATSSALGLVKIEDDTEQSVAANTVSTTAGRTYGVQLNSDDQLVVNVPWADTDTTYSIGDGGLTTNDFTTADHNKLDGIDSGATVDQTQADINALAITTVGTIAAGVWQGTAIGSSYIADAFLKNDADDTTTGTVTAGGFSTAGSVTSNGYKMSSGGYTDIVGTSHTLAAADNGKVLLFTNASAITLTVPSGLTSGHSCTVIQVSGGQIAFDNNSGATEIRNRQGHTKTAGRDARVGLVQYQPDKYNLGGDTAS